ncbi:MAG: glycosyltransferase family 39 protein [Flavobacteriales bacterium]|nr:glycosyltransferase family 39 protein [Flavobacteriales bacterium]
MPQESYSSNDSDKHRMLGKTEKVILAFILFIGAALRIHNFWDFSLSNDELSALARLNFDSFSDLIMNGVRIDGHPAAAQVILWHMTKWFGNGVFVVRLPFVLAGILSVYFMFQLAKEWISTSAGLLSAAVFATLEFPLLYSRIARPYALGMLFALMAAKLWIRIVKQKQKPSDFVWLAFSLALCAYSHYFAALTAGILAFIGLFLIRGKNLKLYLFALIGALLLYLPYIPIFLHQLSLGGVGQWLGPPENDWIFKHLHYVFNDSAFVILLVLAAGIAGVLIFKPKKNFQNHVLPFFLFLTPFLVGFFYSRNVNPVLQDSTLLFSFPFLLVFLFSGWNDGKEKLSYATTGILLFVILLSTTVEKRFYQTNHFGVFKELAEHIIVWNAEVEHDALLIGDFNFPFYIDYYIEKQDPIKFTLYRTTDETGLAELKSVVDTSSKEFLIYAWSTVNQAPEVEAIIQEKFPIEVKREVYFNSEVVMFKKGENESPTFEFNFEKTDVWNFNPDAVQTDSVGSKIILISPENPYGPTLQIALAKLQEKSFSEVRVRIECAKNDTENQLQLVFDQGNENGGYAWESDAFKFQFKKGGPKWGVFYYKLKDEQSDSDVLKIYPWLPEGKSVKMSSMEIRFR